MFRQYKGVHLVNTLIRMLGAAVVTLGLAGGAAQADFRQGSSPTQNKDLVKAAGLVEQSQYAEAIPLLKQVVAAEPNNADAYNLLGYSHRKLGDFDSALGYYQSALKFKPQHLGANEYLGELYLQMGDLEKAEERLKVLDWACLFGCEEYTELKEAIEAYKAKHGS